MGVTTIPQDLAEIEIKGITVGGGVAPIIEDEEKGIVTAFVSLTGVKDKVNDIIEPGAYGNTLKARMPKGIRNHDWKSVVSKPLEVKELLPGDAELPTELSDGSPWPTGAGALRVKAQFNLNSTAGRDAFEDAKFFDDQQEWSIGYNVPKTAGASHKDAAGVRHIKSLELYEYSMVLWGAMPHARTIAVKDLLNGGLDALEEKTKKDVHDDPNSDTLPDGSFPIRDEASLHDAIQSFGRAKDKTAAKAHIMKCAKKLGKEDVIPESWKSWEEAVNNIATSLEDALINGVLDRKSFRSMYSAIQPEVKGLGDLDGHMSTDHQIAKPVDDGGKPKIADDDARRIVEGVQLAEADQGAITVAVKALEDATDDAEREDAEALITKTLTGIMEADETKSDVVSDLAADLLDVFVTKGWIADGNDHQEELDTDQKDDKVTVEIKEFDVSDLEALLK